MREPKPKKRNWPTTLAVLAIILPLAAIILNAMVEAHLKKVMEAKAMREATATVIRKERVRYDETNNEWYDEDLDSKVYHEPGSEDLLVYYRIDSFDPSDEPIISSRLLEIEKRRIASGKLRHRTNSPEEYDRIKIGDTIKVQYHDVVVLRRVNSGVRRMELNGYVEA